MAENTPRGDAMLRGFARKIARLERDLRIVQTAAQGAFRSVEEGAIDFYDETGTLRARVGRQTDGSYDERVLSDTLPPAPTEPDVVVISDGVVAVTWDGRFEEKLDGTFRCVKIHAGDTVDFTPTRKTQEGVIFARRGGTVVVVTESDDDNPVYVRLVAVNKAHQEGPPSTAVLVDEEDLEDYDEEPEELEWEDADGHTLTADDITAGTVTFGLSHDPEIHSLLAWWHPGGLGYAGVPQDPGAYTVNFDTQTITWPLTGFEEAGARLRLYYAYQSAGPQTRYYINDEFDRTTLGSATQTPGGAAVAWETAGGTWVPDGGTLYVQTVTRDTTVCVVDTGDSDGDVTISIIGGDGGAGRALAFRVNNALTSGFGIEMNGRVAYDPSYGTTSDDTTVVNLGVSFLPGDELRVNMAGALLTFFKNGVQVGQATDTRNQTATKHGFAANVGGSASNGFDSFWMTGTN